MEYKQYKRKSYNVVICRVYYFLFCIIFCWTCIFYWHIFDLQCCASFCYIAEWFSCTYVYIFLKYSFSLWYQLCSVAKSCLTLRPHGLQPARLRLCPWDFLGKNTGEVAISFSKGSSWPRDQPCIPCIGRRTQTLMVYHRGLNIFPCAIQSGFVVYPLYV